MRDQPPDLDTDRVRAFLAEVTQNPASFLATFDTLRAQVESNSSLNTPPSSTSPPQPFYDSQTMTTMTQVLATAMRENTPVPCSRTLPEVRKTPRYPRVRWRYGQVRRLGTSLNPADGQ